MKNKFLIFNLQQQRQICFFILDRYIEEHENVYDYTCEVFSENNKINFNFTNGDKEYSFSFKKKTTNIINLEKIEIYIK